MNTIVFVLTVENEDGKSVVGVYSTHMKAYAEKCATIRDCYDIPEDEVADEDLDSEVESMNIFFEIAPIQLDRSLI